MPRLISTRVRLPLMVMSIALVYGTVGFRVIEDYSFIDAVYMTVSTISTIGFGEVEPLSPGGRIFAVSLIVLGVVAVFDLLAVCTALLTSGELNRLVERRKMQRTLDGLRGHYIICAYGRVGRAAAKELAGRGAAVVVIESQPAIEPELIDAGVPYLLGDPTQETLLQQVGITRAAGLLCAVDSDAVNVYITLTARALNPSLFIISRASSPESVEPLHRAGSDRVISPYIVSGVRMATMALEPAVLEFVDMVSMADDLRVEQLIVDARPEWCGRTIKDICAPIPDLMILAVKRSGGDLHVPPRADTVLHEGDVVIALGPASSLARLTEHRRDP